MIICYKVDSIQSMFSTYQNVYHVPELAPDEELFTWYRKKVKDGEWNQKVFDEYYVPWFLKIMEHNREAQEKLDALKKLSEEKDIILCCFCENEDMCHRSIIKRILC